jgi:FkbM family methyltransferase
MDPVSAAIRLAGQLDPWWGAQLESARWRLRPDMPLRVLEAFARRGDVTVDVGANTGLYAFQLARLVGRGGRVHAFEPDPVSVAILQALGRHQANLTVHPIGLSDRSDQATLHVPVFAGRRLGALATLSAPHDGTEVERESVSIRVEPLDATLAHSERPISFIKIDVEGHELAVLRGSEKTLRRFQPAMLIEIEQRHQQQEIGVTFQYLSGLGYAGYAIGPRRLRPIAEFDIGRDQLSFLSGEFIAGAMPPAYVHDFVFVRLGTDVTRLLASD